MSSKLQRFFYLLLGIFIFTGSNVKAQDLLFSQYNYTPFLTNPAMIGTYQDVNVIFNYRNQPVQAGVSFETPMLSATYPFLSKTSGRHVATIGVSGLHDNQADFLKTSGGSLAFAYNLNLGGSAIALGVQGGFYQAHYDFGGFTTASQYNPLSQSYDPNLATAEAFGSDAVSYPLFNLGAMWHQKDALGREKGFLGVSYTNINQPTVSLAGESNIESEIPGMLIANAGYNFMFANDKFSIMPNARFASRLGESFINAGANIRYHINKPNSVFNGSSIGALAWYTTQDKVVVGGELNTPAFMLAVTYDVATSSDAIRVFGNGIFEVTAALKIKKSTEVDTDGDGIIDKNDACPDEPGEKELNGCPDKDSDGIADKYDACPDESGLEDFQGCPDTDEDGIPDKYDTCPEEAGKEEFQGCPDSDSDGIQDTEDKCPDEPGPVTSQGCPDRDEDGTVDSEDKCPDRFGPKSNQGCPELREPGVDTTIFIGEKIDIGYKVEFETGSAVLTERSKGVLDVIAGIAKKQMDKNNSYLEIDGHTDSDGEAQSNVNLSKARVKSVMDYLQSKGVNRAKMVGEGYGEEQPIVPNDTDANKAKNRRVIFNFIDETTFKERKSDAKHEVD